MDNSDDLHHQSRPNGDCQRACPKSSWATGWGCIGAGSGGRDYVRARRTGSPSRCCCANDGTFHPWTTPSQRRGVTWPRTFLETVELGMRMDAVTRGDRCRCSLGSAGWWGCTEGYACLAVGDLSRVGEERPDAGRDRVADGHCTPCYTAPGVFRNRVCTGLSTWRCGRRTNEVLCDP